VPPLDLGLGLRRGAKCGGSSQGGGFQFQRHVISVSVGRRRRRIVSAFDDGPVSVTPPVVGATGLTRRLVRAAAARQAR
jgi:hypothetical protein